MIRAAFTAVTALAALLVAVPAEAAPTLPEPDSHGLTLVSLSQDTTDPRLLDAVVATAAIFQPVHVRIYLPAGYSTNTTARHKTLYLLHGGGDALDDARSWVEEGDVPSLVDATGYPGIVVMPEGGKAGWYTDWAQPDVGGRRPEWETFHIDQLVPWIDANFRTLATKADRAVAGLSMGGYGALSYAARHPELFSAAAEFSGTTNLRAGDTLTINQLFVSLEFGSAITQAQQGDPSFRARGLQAVFGPFLSWAARNPFDLADVYRTRQIQVALYVGDGTGQQNFDVVESLAKFHNDIMHLRLRIAGPLLHRRRLAPVVVLAAGPCRLPPGGCRRAADGMPQRLGSAARLGADQAGDRVGGFAHLVLGFLAAGLRGVDHAAGQVLVEQLQRERLQSLRRRRDLGQDVDAVLVLFDHPLQAADLAFDAAKALEVRVLVPAVACHFRAHLRARLPSIIPAPRMPRPKRNPGCLLI